MQATLTLSGRAVYFWNIYRTYPSVKNKLTDSIFLQEFPELLDICNSTNSSSVIVGDFNFHFDDLNRTTTNKMIDMLNSFNLTQSVNKPTHSRGHILDWVVHRRDDGIVLSTTVTQELSSDHFCVVSEVSVQSPVAPVMYKEVREIRAIDRQALRQDFGALTPVVCPTADALNSSLQTILNKHAPLVRKRVKPERSAPWYDAIKEELRHAKQQRRQAERKWHKFGLTVFKQIYNAAKRRVTRLIDDAKTVFYSSKIADCDSGKQLFSVYKCLSGCESSSPLPVTCAEQELPSKFANFFTTKIANIRAELGEQVASTVTTDSLEHIHVPHSFESFETVTEDDVRAIIVKSKPTTCSLDPIPTPLLVENIDPLLPAVTQVVNESLVTGIFPTTFKTAVVKPLLKKRGLDQNNLKNFRPVSNLSFLSKVIEKVVLKQLFKYLNTHSLLSPNQSAYRPCHSTETALIKVTNDILLALDQGNVSLLTLLDLSAAFDTVDHEIMVKTLQLQFGITGKALSWLRSYMSDRTQFVSINNCCSDPVNLLFGVPQGSVLGPVLFVMYTKPLLDLLDRKSILNQSFADDTQLYCSMPPSEIISSVHTVEDCISDVKAWMNSNTLKLNDDKTEVLLIRSKISNSFDKPSALQVGNAEVSFSASARNLGYTISDTMSLDAHVTNVCRSAYFAIRQISSIRRYLTVDATKTLVCAFVLSRLDYCNSLLSNAPKYIIDRLQKVQNSAARLVLKARKRDHASPLLVSLHWLPVQARIEYKLCVLCHNYFSGTAPEYLSKLLSVYVPTRNLRSSADTRILSVRKVKTKRYGERAFAFCAPER